MLNRCSSPVQGPKQETVSCFFYEYFPYLRPSPRDYDLTVVNLIAAVRLTASAPTRHSKWHVRAQKKRLSLYSLLNQLIDEIRDCKLRYRESERNGQVGMVK